MHDIRGEMYNDSDGKARVSFLFSTKEKDKQGKKGNARIEKKNWNKGREEGAREETPAVVVNQSGNESKGEWGDHSDARRGGETKTKGGVSAG